MNLSYHAITQRSAQLSLLQAAHENKRLIRQRAYLNGNTRSNSDENDRNCRISEMLPTRHPVTGRSICRTAPPSRGPDHAAGEYVVHRRRHDIGMEHVQKSVLL